MCRNNKKRLIYPAYLAISLRLPEALKWCPKIFFAKLSPQAPEKGLYQVEGDFAQSSTEFGKKNTLQMSRESR